MHVVDVDPELGWYVWSGHVVHVLSAVAVPLAVKYWPAGQDRILPLQDASEFVDGR